LWYDYSEALVKKRKVFHPYQGWVCKGKNIMFKTVKITVALLLVIAITAAFSAGCILNTYVTPKAGEGVDVIKEAWDIISREYVEPSRLDSANMTRAAIAGMIETLDDPYTTYLSPQEYELDQSSITGEFDGIGAVVSVQDKNLVIVSPFPDSPADKAGIKAGDTIQKINGESVAGMSLDVAISKIRGPRGTTVKLLILHRGATGPVEIEITRNRVEVASVRFEMRGSIAYINIIQFTGRTEAEFAPFIQQLKDANAKGIVLDLRGNPGGPLDTVIRVASHFIDQGIIVQVKSREGKIETDEAVTGLTTTDLPMVVLVDHFSASGSEVLAGALQDYNRALIAGNTTYGKGSVNYLHKLSDGSGLYITASRWLTPKGRLIEGRGIEPDMRLELTGGDAVNWAIDYLTSGRH
jgi:carboxyl-terminal processing protease